jgi:predicted SAM-dependent methyltransferase
MWKRKLIEAYKRLIGQNKSREITPSKNKKKGIRLHLGAGDINILGYINIDGRSASHIHIQSKDFGLSEFTEESIDEIYLCHVLEHFSFEDAQIQIKNFFNKLRKGGVLRISVPDFDKLIGVYQNNKGNIIPIQYALLGGQNYEYNFHKSIYNKRSLKQMLTNNGFRQIESWSGIDDFGIKLTDWSDTKLKTPAGVFDISLNIKAIK